MIDAHLYNEEDPDGTPTLRALDAEIKEKKSGSDIFDYDYDDNHNDSKKTAEVKASTRDSLSLLEEEYSLCSPFVHGYCLPHKLWGISHFFTLPATR